jgi:hypothetical protein
MLSQRKTAVHQPPANLVLSVFGQLLEQKLSGSQFH